MVDRRVNAQLTVQRFPFHTQLIRLAFLRVEARTLQAGAAVGLKGTGGIGIDGNRIGQVVDQAKARGDAVFALAEVAVCGPLVVVIMLETFEAHTGQRLQALGKGHLVLDEEGPGFQVFCIPGCRHCS
ncbi:hypothetical protein D3C85_1316310 [compost metagenome]